MADALLKKFQLLRARVENSLRSVGGLFARESDSVILTTREGRPVARRTIDDFARTSFGVEGGVSPRLVR